VAEKKRIYIICPVRKKTRAEERKINKYVRQLEDQGHEVRLPYRDTNQVDEIGLRIVEEHEKDIIWADEVHIWWNPNSIGSHWDLAQVRMVRIFMPKKKIVLINEANVEITKYKDGSFKKSYTNVLLATHFDLDPSDTGADLLKAKKAAKHKGPSL
jgi:hypothetical protein